MDMIGYIRASDSKIEKIPNKMMIACRILERITIRHAKLDIELQRSLNNALITKSNMIKEILDILFLGDKKIHQKWRKPQCQESSKEDQDPS
jgi:hypothetical protein